MSIGAQRDVEAGTYEIVHQNCDLVDSRLGRQPHRAVVEQPDGAADVGHRLPAEMFSLFERLDSIVDVAILLQAAPGRGGVQQGDRQRMSDHVVHLAGDASALVRGSMLGQHRLRFLLLDQQLLLRVHEIANQPTHSDETQIQRDYFQAVGRRRGNEQCSSGCGRRQTADHIGERADDAYGQDQQQRGEVGGDRR